MIRYIWRRVRADACYLRSKVRAALRCFVAWLFAPTPTPPAGHYLKERYGLDEKPPGWNRRVLGWFYRGPELREPGDEFRCGWAERAGVPARVSLSPRSQRKE